jgi:hypothetical protein
MRINVADEVHVKINLAWPVAYNFIDDAIDKTGSSPLRLYGNCHIADECKSPFLDYFISKKSSTIKTKRM